MIYYLERGIYFGSRFIKCCKKCKLYEYYGFWIYGGKKYFDGSCLKNKYLLLIEDIVFEMFLLR